MKKKKCTNKWQKNYTIKCGYYDNGNCTRKVIKREEKDR